MEKRSGKQPDLLEAEFDADIERSLAELRADGLDGYCRTVASREHPYIEWPHPRAPKKSGDAPPNVPDPRFVENTARMCDSYGIKVRHNLMRHALEIEIPGFSPSAERAENANLAYFSELCTRNGLSVPNSLDHLQSMTSEYHPVRDWIAGREWDGLDRMPEFLGTIGLAPDADPALCGMLVTRWLVSCVAAVMPRLPGSRPFTPQGVLTLQGPQGIGKTEWFKSLAPDDCGWISAGRMLDPHDRDSVQQATSHWIVELGEVDATFRRADVAALKAFVTSEVDVYRSAYARREERVPRRTVLGASVNEPKFLVDPTGNRRWWTVACLTLRARHGIDVQQLWAQVARMYADGSAWWLDSEELASLSTSNREHESRDPLIDDLWSTWRVATAIVGSEPRVTIPEIWDALPGRSGRTRSRMDANTLSQELRNAGCENSGKRNGFTTYRVERINAATGGGWQQGTRWTPGGHD